MSKSARKLLGKNKTGSQPEQSNAADPSDEVDSDNVINQTDSSNGDTNDSNIGVTPTGESSPSNLTILNFNQLGSGVGSFNDNSDGSASSTDRGSETDGNSSNTGNLVSGNASNTENLVIEQEIWLLQIPRIREI
jgi:hypothetical protein